MEEDNSDESDSENSEKEEEEDGENGVEEMGEENQEGGDAGFLEPDSPAARRRGAEVHRRRQEDADVKDGEREEQRQEK